MSRPEVGSDRRRRAVLVGALLLAFSGFLPHSVAGAFPNQASAPANAAGRANDSRSGPDTATDKGWGLFEGDGTYGPEQRAHELYLDGVEKLDGGHRDWAQRTFETVIARFPNSAAAGLARSRLADLYRTTPADGAATPTPAPATAPAASRTVPPAAPPGRGPAWRQELRRNAPIQAKLRGEAGDRIFFSAGSAELGTRARTALAAQAQWLIRWHEFEAAVEGHADEPGTDEENLTLARQRAEAVRQRLIEEGVEAGRLSVVAAGRAERVATCTAPDCSSQNRRVVTLVFASGTRARLGLAGPATADASADRAPTISPAAAVRTPQAPQQVGVTR